MTGEKKEKRQLSQYKAENIATKKKQKSKKVNP